jgi:hypothetical protein
MIKKLKNQTCAPKWEQEAEKFVCNELITNMYLSLEVIFGRPGFDFIPLKASGIVPKNFFLSLSPFISYFILLTLWFVQAIDFFQF